MGVWLLIVLVAVINGGIRQTLISTRTGDTLGHAISTIMRCAAILLLGWATIVWMRPATRREVWWTLWVTLTLAFEFIAGHYVCDTPWRHLLADYNIFRGRIWVLVPVTTAIAVAGGALPPAPSAQREWNVVMRVILVLLLLAHGIAHCTGVPCDLAAPLRS